MSSAALASNISHYFEVWSIQTIWPRGHLLRRPLTPANNSKYGLHKHCGQETRAHSFFSLYSRLIKLDKKARGRVFMVRRAMIPPLGLPS